MKKCRLIGYISCEITEITMMFFRVKMSVCNCAKNDIAM